LHAPGWRDGSGGNRIKPRTRNIKLGAVSSDQSHQQRGDLSRRRHPHRVLDFCISFNALGASVAPAWMAAVLVSIIPGLAAAQDATWSSTPVSTHFYDGHNWGPQSLVTGTATFGASTTTTIDFAVPAWSSSTPYVPGTKVIDNGVAYVAVTGNLNVPTMDDTSWAPVAATYSNATTYNVGDQVTYNGVTYAARGNGVMGVTPGTDPSQWVAFTGNGVGGFTFTPGASNYTFSLGGDSLSFTGAGIVVNGGSVSFVNGSGSLNFLASSTAGSATITTNSGAHTVFGDSASGGTAQLIVNSGGVLSFIASSAAGSATVTTNTGGQTVFANSASGGTSQLIVNGTGLLSFTGSSTAGSATITTNSGAQTVFTNTASGGAARFILSGSGLLDISQLTNGGTNAGSIEGNGNVLLGAKTLTVGGNNSSTIFSGVLQDGGSGGSLTKVGTGTLTLSGISTYSGATTIDGGVLNVTGALTNTGHVTVNGGTLNVTGSVADPTVNAGGVLTGTGTVGDTTINAGGTFVPGNASTPGTSMTVAGSLAFASGAQYVVALDPSAANAAIATGQATLGGATVNAVFAAGSYVEKQYTILTANGGVSGTFGALTSTNLPSAFHATLGYDATSVSLYLTLNFVAPGGLSGNQQAVADTLANYFNTQNRIPVAYGALTAAGLSQAAGEPATGMQQTTFNAMTQYLTLLTDPWAGADASNGASASAYAEEGVSAAASRRYGREAEAYAMATKAPPGVIADPRWNVWAAGFGGSATTSGNAVAGSNDTTSRIAGTAVGASYRFSPWTTAGFSLAGGGTSFGVNGLGGGRSDLFQTGAYLRHDTGAAYLTAAAAYGWQAITTDRTVTAAGVDRLRAEFDANTYAARIEGGYRFAVPWANGFGLTPYAAAQSTTFDLPAYTESAIAGTSNFALAYAAKRVTDRRSELGLRADKSFGMADGALVLRGRLAWAHDADPDRAIAATFQALPGASFAVNGARQARDSGLTTVTAEYKWLNGWSAAGTFDGEFSNVTRSYAGRGVVRYAW